MVLQFLVDSTSDLSIDAVLSLSGAEAHHAINVRRVSVGEKLRITNGAGLLAHGVCESIANRELNIRITDLETLPAAKPRIILVQALAKGDRDELAIQAATELGVDEVWPWQAKRSVSRWDGAKLKKGRDRWQSIVREAAKQAHRAWVPEVSAPVSTAELIRNANGKRMLVLEPTAITALSELSDFATDEDLLLIVGPEGGISSEELEMFESSGAQLLKLGENVLRTSTAGPVALTVLSVALSRI